MLGCLVLPIFLNVVLLKNMLNVGSGFFVAAMG